MKILTFLLAVLFTATAQAKTDEAVATDFSKHLLNCINGGTVQPADYDLWNKPGFKFTLRIICKDKLAQALFSSLAKLKHGEKVADIETDTSSPWFYFGLVERMTNNNRGLGILDKKYYESATNGSMCRKGISNSPYYCEIAFKMTLTQQLDKYVYDALENNRLRGFDNPIQGVATSAD